MKRAVKLISCFLCITIVAGVALALTIPKNNADAGRAARKRYQRYQFKLDELANAPFEENGGTDDRVAWFPVPAGFSDIREGGSGYTTTINPDLTPTEWANLTDILQMKLVSQLPAEVISNASTSELLLYCMNYNFFDDVLAYDTAQGGFEAIYRDYNGLQELFSREDAAQTVLDLYKAYDLEYQADTDMYAFIRFTYLQAILSQEEIINALTAEQCRELASECYSKALEIIDSQYETYMLNGALHLGISCLYFSDAAFAEIVDESEAAVKYIETGRLDIDDISDDELGAIVAYLRRI